MAKCVELRSLALSQWRKGKKVSVIADNLELKPDTVRSWIRQFTKSKKTAPSKPPGRPRSVCTPNNKGRVKRLLSNGKSGRACGRSLKLKKSSVFNMIEELSLKVRVFFSK
jgi:uncharacterized protein YjcR